MISSCNTNFASCDVFQVLTLGLISWQWTFTHFILTGHYIDGRSPRPHADLYCTFLRYWNDLFWFTTSYILCSHFQYTVTWVPNVCTGVHGNVFVHVHSVDMFVKTRAMSCYKFGPLWWGDTCNVGTLWLGTKGVRWRQVLLYQHILLLLEVSLTPVEYYRINVQYIIFIYYFHVKIKFQ